MSYEGGFWRKFGCFSSQKVWVMNTTQREVVCVTRVTRVTRVVPGDAVTLIKAVFLNNESYVILSINILGPDE